MISIILCLKWFTFFSIVDALAVYVKNLPLHATPSQLEEAFKAFGTIKPDGIQVRSHKVRFLCSTYDFCKPNSEHLFLRFHFKSQIQGFCYGFIEFEDASSVQSALAVIFSPAIKSFDCSLLLKDPCHFFFYLQITNGLSVVTESVHFMIFASCLKLKALFWGM
jgi:hypothetical protein